MLRRSAEVVKDPRLRKQLLQIAAQYEHLVRHEESLCSADQRRTVHENKGDDHMERSVGTIVWDNLLLRLRTTVVLDSRSRGIVLIRD
jgi:hypothetical protein